MLYDPEQSQYVVETIESAVEEIVTEGVEIGRDSSIPSSIMDDFFFFFFFLIVFLQCRGYIN